MLDTLLNLLYFVLILGVIVLVHEFGHFIFAKMFGVHVYEFSIGMGSRLIGTKPNKDKTTYNLRLIPIGGFVQLAGEEVDGDEDVPLDKKLYKKPVWQRFLIMFFGAGNNIILALLIFFFIGIFHGSQVMDPVFTKVEEGYPVYEAGIRDGDRIVSINGKKTSTIDDVQVYLTLNARKDATTFVVEHDGVEKEYKITPKEVEENGEKVYRYGITFAPKTEKGFVNAIKYSFTKVGALIKQMCIVIGSLFTGKLGLNSLSGPVGIYSYVGQTAATGLLNVFALVALLSVNVGFLNLIPLPAFDGGRIFFLLIEMIKGSPVSPKVENTIHSIGFILLMILMLVITFNDVIRLF